MVRNGQAVLVTRAAEVLELVASAGEHLLPQQQGPRRRTDDLDPVQLGVFEALSARRWRTPGEVATVGRGPGARLPGGAVRARVARAGDRRRARLAGDADRPRTGAGVTGSALLRAADRAQRAPRRNASSSGPAVPEPDSPSST